MQTPGAVMAVGGLLLLTAPAAYAEPVRPGEESTYDLGILPPSTPDVLKQAADAPYAAPSGEDCESIAREIAALDAVLGPDADTPKKDRGGAGRFVGQAVKSLIPYRSVVRLVTGADRKQRERDQAAMAGWARRGYLKGVQANQGCPGATAEPTVAAAQPPPALASTHVGAQAATPERLPAPSAAVAPEPLSSPTSVRLGRVSQPEPAAIETTFAR